MSVSFHQRASGVLLTKQDIEAWQAEAADLEEHVGRMYHRMGELRELIEAAEFFLQRAQPKAALQAPPVNQDMPLTDAIIRVFERERRHLKANEIRAALGRDPTQAARLKSNPNYFHTAMKRLRDRGLIIREGDSDRLVAKENGALNGNAASAPETGEVGASPIERPEEFRLQV